MKNLASLRKAIEVLSHEFSPRQYASFLAMLSSFNRIQGTPELEAAADYIASRLSTLTDLSISVYSYNYGSKYGLAEPLAGWWVNDAELWLVKPRERVLHSFREASTLVVAHSPGGEAIAPVIYVGKGEDPKDYKGKDVGGKFILAYGRAYYVYNEANSRGAIGILLYRKEGGPSNAIPYMGLFLTPEEAKDAKALVLSISRKTAHQIMKYLERGEEVIVRARIEAGYRPNAEMKVIEARYGNSNKEIHLVAHYCHPGGTVNDNASGAAALMELAVAMDRAIKKKLLKPTEISLVFVWTPEYYGTLPYLLDKTQNGKILSMINLDMIGEKQEITGSVLQLIRSPPPLYTAIEALLHLALQYSLPSTSPFSSPDRVLTVRYESVMYECGSDHDIYILMNIPAVMLNQWPDEFYHTNMDTMDKVDVELAKRIAVAAGAAAYIFALFENLDELKTYIYHYYASILHKELGKSCDKPRIYRLRLNYLCNSLANYLESIVPELTKSIRALCEAKSTIPGEELKYRTKLIGVLTLRSIYRIDKDLALKIQKFLEKEPWLRTAITLIQLTLNTPKSKREVEELVDAIMGKEIPKEFFDMIFKALEMVGAIEKENR